MANPSVEVLTVKLGWLQVQIVCTVYTFKYLEDIQIHFVLGFFQKQSNRPVAFGVNHHTGWLVNYYIGITTYTKNSLFVI